jgi:Mg-chelatase subunit ChlD
MMFPAVAIPSLALDYLSPLAAAGLYLLLAALTVALWLRSATGQTPVRQWVTLGIRLIILGLLVLVLAGARWSRPLKDVEVVVLRDASASADQAQQLPGPTLDAAINDYLRDTTNPDAKPPADRVGVIRFAREPALESMPEATYRPASGAIAEAGRRDDTDVAAAVRLALSSMAGDALHRIVLMWDGRATRGDLAAAAREAAARHVPIDVMPLEYRGDREVTLERLDAPPRKREGEPFSLRAVLRSTNPADVRGKLALRDRGQSVDMNLATPGLQTSKSITLTPGLNIVTLDIPPGGPGVHDFQAAFEAENDTDTQVANNTARAFTVVTGRSRILYVDNVPDAGGDPLAAALTPIGNGQSAIGNPPTFDLHRISPRDFPPTLAELQGYDAVILANVPRGAGGLDEAQQKALASYVHDLGGGLVVIGGPDAYGAGGWIGSDLEKVLPVDCSIPSRRVLPAGLLVIVLDRSGSMSAAGVAGARQTKQELANEAAILAVRALAPQDLVGVVAFDGQAEWAVPLRANANPNDTAAAIRTIGNGGGTSIPAGLAKACEAVESAAAQNAAVRHVLLLTDGQSVEGDYPGLVARLRRAGATLSTVGVGSDVNPQLLSGLAADGKGRYYPIADPTTLPQIFIKEARTIRRTLIRESPFTPSLAATDSPLVAGLTAVPPLRGMVLTTPKSNPNVRVPLLSPDGDPVLAHGQAGLGRVVAFTSDAANVWGAAWASSPIYQRFWTDAVQWAARPPVNTDFQVLTSRSTDGTRAKVTVLADDKDGTSKNFLAFQGHVVAPDAAARDLRLAQIGPGRYEGEFDLDRAGNYVGMLQYRTPAGETGTLPVGFTLENSAELRETSSDNAAMLAVVNATGGRMLRPWDAASARLFTREGLTPETVSRPAWDALIALLVGLFLVDVAARRLAWGRDDLSRAALATGAWIRSHTTVRPADPTASLDALRSIRTRAAEQSARPRPVRSNTTIELPRAPRAADPEPPATGLLAAKRRAQRRFNE